MTITGGLFAPEVLESLDDDARSTRIADLATRVNSELANAVDLGSFQARLYAVIDELKSIGHDLWSHDYDCEIEQWGGNYMHPATAGKLWLTSTYPTGVVLQWQEWDDSISDDSQ